MSSWWRGLVNRASVSTLLWQPMPRHPRMSASRSLGRCALLRASKGEPQPLNSHPSRLAEDGSHLRMTSIFSSSPPPVLPDLFADHAIDPWLLPGHRDDPWLGCQPCDFEQQLGPDRLLEFFAFLDRHHEGAGAADDAVLVVEIEIIDVHRRIGWLLHHDRQAVDGDALLQRHVACAGDRRAIVVGAVA